MTVTNSWIAYSEKVFQKARETDEEIISRALYLPPKPHYPKGDTTAASARIADIRQAERLALKVARELIIPIEEQAARFRPRFKAIVDGILARPIVPARRSECPAPRVHVAGPVELKERDVGDLAVSPAATAIVALCGCRWPIGEPSSNVFHFCNKKRAAHNFYCEYHARKSVK